MSCTYNENTTIHISAGIQENGTIIPFDSSPQSYYFLLDTNETVTFHINLSVSGSTTPNVTMRIYEIVGPDTYSLVGTSYLYSQINVFQFEGSVGEYIFCFESFQETTYTLSLDFTEYHGIVLINIDGYDGEVADTTFAPPLPKECKSQVAFKLIDGNVPLNISFSSDGTIEGVPSEQDCQTDDAKPPSFTWFEIDENNTSKAIPNEYPIRVRAYLLDYPFVFVDGFFKICVLNNWDFDRDAFLEQEFTIREEVCEPEE